MMQPTTKYWPYRLAVHLLYTQHPSISRLANDELVLQIGPLAAHLGIKNYMLKQYLEELVNMGLASDFRPKRGYAIIKLRKP